MVIVFRCTRRAFVFRHQQNSTYYISLTGKTQTNNIMERKRDRENAIYIQVKCHLNESIHLKMQRLRNNSELHKMQ